MAPLFFEQSVGDVASTLPDFAFMVVAAFPLAKLGFLLLKQLSKPVANYIKNEAKKHPYWRKYVIMPTGRVFYRLDRLTDKTASSVPLSEAEAVELGANALGEIILFGLLSVVLIFEIGRQSDKKATIQRNRDEEVANVRELLTELTEEFEVMSKKIKLIEKQLQGALNVMDLEDHAHVVVNDNNFLDIVESHKLRLSKRNNDFTDDSA